MSGGQFIAITRAEPYDEPDMRDADILDADILDLVSPIAPAPPPGIDEPTERLRRDRVTAGIAWAAAIGWIAGACWWTRQSWAMLMPAGAIELAAAIVAVPVLIGVLYLLAMRGGRVEGDRLARAAASMRAQTTDMQASADAIAATLDANRRALTEQWERLAALSEAATERLHAIGGALGDEVALAEDRAQRLAQAADQGVMRVKMLTAALPRAQDDIHALAGSIDTVGEALDERIAALDARLVALAHHGRDAQAVADGSAAALAGHLQTIESVGAVTGERLARTAGDMASAIDALLDRTAGAIDSAHHGIAAQGQAMTAMVGAHQASLDAAARGSAESLAERIGAIETAIDRIAARLEEQRIAGHAIVDGLAEGLGDVDGRLDTLHRHGTERTQLLAASISALGGSADAMTESLKVGDAMATRTISTTETLLIALDAAAREIDETLPDALGRLDSRVTASRTAVAQTKPELLALVTAAESTHDAIEAIASVIADQRRTVDQLSTTLLDTLTDGQGKADALGQMVDETVARTHRFAEEAAPRLIDALLRVRETASVAADKARETLADVIPDAARQLGEATAGAMARAADESVVRQLGAIRGASDDAVDATARAAEQLSRQVQAIVDHNALIEARMADARSERDAVERDTLARRSALLIETMNSAAIDIVKAFAPDVSDSAWAAYLKGDRGVFTRRAVRILDSGDARDIARLYDADLSFRDMVNRYIHDFEAMLRQVLAQRDGSPLGVTLLSSDIGKLYVALAQAIERLR